MIKNYFVIAVCIVMGVCTAGWLTFTQSEFLATLGLSKWAVISMEPSLALIALLLGFRISGFHRTLSLGLLILLFCASLIATSSLYTKHLFAEVEQADINKEQVNTSRKNEDTIREALDSLVNRGASSKSTLALIGKLENQQQITQSKTEVTDLSAIVGIISTLFNLEERKALIGFALLISFTAVSIPSYCFFSSGLLIGRLKKPGEVIVAEIEDDTIEDNIDFLDTISPSCEFDLDDLDMDYIADEIEEEQEEKRSTDEVNENMREVVRKMDIKDIANNCERDIYSKVEGGLEKEIDSLVDKVCKDTLENLKGSEAELERAILSKIKSAIIKDVNVAVSPEVAEVKDRIAVKVEKNLNHYKGR